MSEPRSTSLQAGLAILTATACGSVLWLALVTLARPSDYAARETQLEARVAEIERLSKTRDSSTFGPRAICKNAEPGELAAVQQTLSGLAGSSSVTLTYLAVQPPAGDSAAALTPIGLQIEAQGPYDALSGFIDHIAKAQPEIFVDRLDLRPSGQDVMLKLSGKVFCWNSARS